MAPPVRGRRFAPRDARGRALRRLSRTIHTGEAPRTSRPRRPSFLTRLRLDSAAVRTDSSQLALAQLMAQLRLLPSGGGHANESRDVRGLAR